MNKILKIKTLVYKFRVEERQVKTRFIDLFNDNPGAWRNQNHRLVHLKLVLNQEELF